MAHLADAFSKKWHLYVLEATLLFIMLLPIHTIYDVAFISYPIVAVLATALYQLVIMWREPLYAPMTIIPLIVFAGYFAGYPLFIAFVISFFLYWRNVNLKVGTPASIGQLLFLTLLFAVPYYVFFQHPEIPWFVLGQLILIAVVKMLDVSFSGYGDAGQRRKYMGMSTLFLLLCTGLSFAGVLIYPYALIVLYGLLNIIFLIAGWIASPLFYLMDYLDIDMRGDEPEDQSTAEFNGSAEESMFEIMTAPGSQYYDYIAWGFGILTLALFSIFVLKKLKQNHITDDAQYEFESLEKTKPEKKLAGTFKSYDRHLNSIRQSFFSLQKTLGRYGYPRDPSVTAEDWISALPLANENRDTVISTYTSVRYGHEQTEKKQVKAYNRAIKELKKEAKEKNKKEV